MKRIMSRLMLAPLFALVVLSAGAASLPAIANAQVPVVYLSTPVTGAVVDKGKQVTFSIDVNNTSKAGQNVNLDMTTAPEGWTPILKDQGFVVRSVWVAPEKTETVSLQLTVPKDAKNQDYKFTLKASGNGFDPTTLNLLLGVQDQSSQATTALVVQYPTISGKAGAAFGFKADLNNNGLSDVTYGLSAKAPDGWDVVFKPSYQDTQISSAQVKAGSSQSLDITVTPPTGVKAGEYPITITAASPTDRASSDLKAIVTGSYQITMSARNDIWNTTATAGQDSPFYVTVTNSGSAPLQNVTLSSTKPQNWTVTFNPATIAQLDPGASREVAMVTKPATNAIAGDYMLTVTSSNTQATLDRDVRVQVSTPTLWGWVGIVVLVVVIGGLLGLFMKLGRR
ncbi:MAG: NEW3 domain-containing protein [Bacteroidetes bacterium]|nr:NEW3 domain-containing protein [Bacteroidota bacterium]